VFVSLLLVGTPLLQAKNTVVIPAAISKLISIADVDLPLNKLFTMFK